LAGIGLVPDDQIEHVAIDFASDARKRVDMPPIHADVVNGAVAGGADSRPEASRQKRSEYDVGHLAGGEGELVMTHAPATLDMAADPYVVRRVGEDHRRWFALRETRVIRSLARVAAQNP